MEEKMKEQAAPETVVVTASLVSEDSQRLKILPLMFGRHFMRGEALAYIWLRRLSKSYDGGVWNYYTLSNGGYYMAPDMGDACLTMRVNGNGFEGSMSPDAAGIVTSLFALDQVMHEVKTKDERDFLLRQYYRLLNFVMFHPERHSIIRATD